MGSAVVFDDGGGELGPLTDLRPSFLVRTGAVSTLERLSSVLDALAGWRVVGVRVPAALEAITRERLKLPVNERSQIEDKEGRGVLCVNGRLAAPGGEIAQLKPGEAIAAGETVIAACLKAKDAPAFLESGSLPRDVKRREGIDAGGMLEKPWDVIRWRDAAMEIDLAALLGGEGQSLPEGVIAIDEGNIRISPTAVVYPGVVLDAEGGPIVIDDETTVRPGSVIVGPAYIGPGCTVLDRALIKAHTAIGPVCKVAGEVGGTIFQGFANKGHDGHLGDSWIGEWVNLGAGTTNSNLLNTYGEVIAQASPGGKRSRTGLTFLGCVIGDHVKTAIMTRIMTGSVFGTGSMIASSTSPPTTLGRFRWLTDEREQPYRWEKFEEVMKAAMSRRKTTPSAGYIERLKSLQAAG